ncbi:hypothetical protein V5O48_006291 [Marasmius crinis-equi]|uniref:Uncharacterized protein n=1 Tax=Marasmius crinis-equi TaxID=585013 RepID=A0ABR3FJX3_9AGAR
MAFSSEVERQRYSQQLAEYTLRQFTAARVTMDKDEIAAAKLPPAHKNKISRWVYSGATTPKRSETIRQPIAA